MKGIAFSLLLVALVMWWYLRVRPPRPHSRKQLASARDKHTTKTPFL